MKSKFVSILAITAAVFAFSLPARAGTLRIVTTYTDLAEFTRAIGGNLADVKSLCTGIEDSHGVPMKPSFLPLLNRADLVVLMGLENEHAYLPALLDACKNPKIMKGKPGYVDCSRNITPRDVPKTTDRAEGDVHPAGNPHFNLDPVLARTIIQNIYEAMAEADPDHATVFAQNRDAYLAKLDAKIAEWAVLAAPLKGVKFVSYHEHWPYFAERYGLTPLGTIEIKPGIDPTPRHITELVALMKAEKAQVVIREPQFPERVPKQVAEETGAALVKMPVMVGGVPEAKTYIEMIDYDLHTLLSAVKQ